MAESAKHVRKNRPGDNPPGLAAFFSIAISLVGSCQSNDSKQIVVANDARLEGSLDAESLRVTNGSILGFVINKDGMREPIANFRLVVPTESGPRVGTTGGPNIKDGGFDLGLSSAHVIPVPLASPPEQFAFMGYSVPADHPVFQGKFGERAIGFARIELIGDEAAKASKPVVPYTQLLIPVSRRLVLAGQEPLVVTGKDNGKIRLDTGLGHLRITTIDRASRQPIEGVSVTAIALVKGQPILTPDDPNFGPVFSVTDVVGKADIYGIRPVSGSEASAQIMATKSGYCNYVSMPEPFVVGASADRQIELETCSDAALAKPGYFKLAFVDSIKVAKIDISGQVEERGLVSSDKAEVRVFTSSSVLRPLRVLVYEGGKAEGQARFELKFPTFSSVLNIDVPIVFSGGRSPSGAFVISMQAVFSDADKAAYGNPPLHLLYGLKSVGKPTVNPEDVSFSSSAGIDGIISGRSGQTFSMTYKNCQDNAEVAIWLGAASPASGDLHYVRCKPSGLLFKGEEVGLGEAGLGGMKVAQVHYRDPYGNTNEILLTGTDGKKAVYVDFGVPDLSTQPVGLGVDFGFAPKSDAAGSDGQTYVFKPAIILTRSNLSNYLTRFANSGACKHGNPSIEDGKGATDRGHLIASYVTGLSPAVIQSLTSDTKCPDDRASTSLDVLFPDDPNTEASLYLRVRDLSGNYSLPFRYGIPPCVSHTTSGHVCWE